ncbi:MAG: hypothetical protein WA474_19685, partial [Candidatus Sulfotelmatobacter sp.]
MKSREEWLKEVAQRQDNIDPIRRIPNAALFQGTLINGSRHLNGPQRVGALIAGLFALTFGCVGLAEIIVALRSWSLGGADLYMTVFCPFSFWIGWKMTMNALINAPRT